MKFFFFIILNFFFFQFVEMFQYSEIVSYDKPILSLLHEDNIIKTFSHKKNFQLNKTNNIIELSYFSSTLGYNYNAFYKIEKNLDSFEIFYKNKYLENRMKVIPLSSKKIQVSSETNTFIPIPTLLLRNIIRKKIRALFTD